jgi:hypothetical protein
MAQGEPLVAWNPRFLEHTGFSEDEIKTSKAEELLTFGESWFPLSNEGEEQTVEYIACAARWSHYHWNESGRFSGVKPLSWLALEGGNRGFLTIAPKTTIPDLLVNSRTKSYHF